MFTWDVVSHWNDGWNRQWLQWPVTSSRHLTCFEKKNIFRVEVYLATNRSTWSKTYTCCYNLVHFKANLVRVEHLELKNTRVCTYHFNVIIKPIILHVIFFFITVKACNCVRAAGVLYSVKGSKGDFCPKVAVIMVSSVLEMQIYYTGHF